MLEIEENAGKREHLIKRFTNYSSLTYILIGVIVGCLFAGVGTGYLLASTSTKNSTKSAPVSQETVKSAQQDTKTFRDFAEGIIKMKDAKTSTYEEGTHILVRENAVPVALTSSVVDLSKYEGKKVKVYGETQKALKQGWLMDVGKVEAK